MDFDHHFVDLAVNYTELDLVDHQSFGILLYILLILQLWLPLVTTTCILRCSRSRFCQLINGYSIWNSYTWCILMYIIKFAEGRVLFRCLCSLCSGFKLLTGKFCGRRGIFLLFFDTLNRFSSLFCFTLNFGLRKSLLTCFFRFTFRLLS